MALTRDFKETVMADLQRDRAYRVAYLGQAIECLHGGEFAVGKRLLRDYINGTLGFAALSKATSTPAKSLMRMLSESSNPHADKLFAILGRLQETSASRSKSCPPHVREAPRGTLVVRFSTGFARSSAVRTVG